MGDSNGASGREDSLEILKCLDSILPKMIIGICQKKLLNLSFSFGKILNLDVIKIIIGISLFQNLMNRSDLGFIYPLTRNLIPL